MKLEKNFDAKIQNINFINFRAIKDILFSNPSVQIWVCLLSCLVVSLMPLIIAMAEDATFFFFVWSLQNFVFCF